MIQRLFTDYKFFAPPMLRYWTEDPGKAVHFPDKQLADEQRDRLPFVTETIFAPFVGQDSHR